MPGLPIPSASRMGRLVVNPSGVSPTATETDLRGPGWWVLDMSPLDGITLRGENVLVPHSTGRKPEPLILDESLFVMPFVIVGDSDRAGNATATGANGPLVQLESNWGWLLAHVAGPYDGTVKTRAVKWIKADGTSKTADGQFRLDIVKQRGAIYDVVLSLTVPAGRWA